MFQSSADQERAGLHGAIQSLSLLRPVVPSLLRTLRSSSGFCAYSQQSRRDIVKDRVGGFTGTRPESGHIPLARIQSSVSTQLKGGLENEPRRKRIKGLM